MLEYLVLRLLYSKVVIQYTWLGVVCADVGISSSKLLYSKVVIQYTWLGVVCADVGISSYKVVIL